MTDVTKARPFPSAGQDLSTAGEVPVSPQSTSPSYRLAYADTDLMVRDELRSVRLQLELLKPELGLEEHGIASTIVVFGSARIPAPELADDLVEQAEAAVRDDPDDPDKGDAARRAVRLAENSRYYDEARRFAFEMSRFAKTRGNHEFVIVTGGGGGIMEAANRGAAEAEAKTVGLNIVLPKEQGPNRYITPELSFRFHYFAIRKMHFLMRARALAIFPGGFGTLDELFDALTLIQTKKIERIPVLMFGAEYWKRVISFDALVDEGSISPEDRDLISYVDHAEEAIEIIRTFYGMG